MKFAIVICFIVIASVQAQGPDPEKMKKFFENVNACGTELNVDVSFVNPEKIPANREEMETKLKGPEYKCLAKCLLSKAGVIDDIGNVHFELIKEMMPSTIPDDVQQKIKKCIDDNKSVADLCDRFNMMQKCIKEEFIPS